MAEKAFRKTAEATRLSQQVERLSLIALDELDGALELMFYGLKGMVREADLEMAKDGFARSHHRILFVVARQDGVSVGELQAALGVSPQALHRPLRELVNGGYVMVTRDRARHRFKALHLTERGLGLEYRASECERDVMRNAFVEAGAPARSGWEAVMKSVAASA